MSRIGPRRRPLLKLARVVVVLVATAISYPVLVVMMLLGSPWPNARRAVRNRIFRVWSKLVLRALGCRLRVEGQAPTAPFFLVSNHLSYLDIVALASVVDVYFIAKAEIAGWPGLGLLSRTVGTIFIDRALRRDVQRVNGLVEEVFREGYGVVLFPEGTSSQGCEVLPFKSSLLAYPVAAGLSVATASLTYATPPEEIPAHLSVCWWGDAPFAPHLAQLLGVRRIDGVLRFLGTEAPCEDRKELARRLHERMVSGFDPVVAVADRASETGFQR